jgi:hypothetical protein
VAFTREPVRVVVLGALDGLPVAESALAGGEAPYEENAWLPDLPVVLRRGCVWLVAPEEPGSAGARLHALDASRGVLEVDLPVAPPHMQARIAGDTYVAVLTGPERVQLLSPAPLGGLRAPPHVLEEEDLGRLAAVLGDGLNPGTRLYAAGSVLFFVSSTAPRPGAEDGFSVAAFRLDEEAFTPRPTGAGAPRRPALRPLHAEGYELALGSSQGPYLLDATVRRDGLLLTAVAFGGGGSGRPSRGVLWVSAAPRLGRDADGTNERRAVSFSFPSEDEGELIEPRRHGPARVGDRLYMPTDAGARVVPVVPTAPTRR